MDSTISLAQFTLPTVSLFSLQANQFSQENNFSISFWRAISLAINMFEAQWAKKPRVLPAHHANFHFICFHYKALLLTFNIPRVLISVFQAFQKYTSYILPECRWSNQLSMQMRRERGQQRLTSCKDIKPIHHFQVYPFSSS